GEVPLSHSRNIPNGLWVALGPSRTASASWPRPSNNATVGYCSSTDATLNGLTGAVMAPHPRFPRTGGSRPPFPLALPPSLATGPGGGVRRRHGTGPVRAPGSADGTRRPRLAGRRRAARAGPPAVRRPRRARAG